ncbi:MAG: tetratricopeptide repeat protein [Candidatus Latescibacterota bacterium]|nr:tetratricopeptide repeat protein [Candidatus Latescibacterota bacterium]
MRSDRLLLLAILLIGASLRFSGLDWSVDQETGELHKFHPDEATVLNNARWLDEDITKITSAYGVIPVYVMFAVGKVSGIVFDFKTFSEDEIRDIRLTYLTARTISATLGTLTILIVFLIGHIAGGSRIGGLSAAILAFSPGHIQQCHFYTVDASMTFWVTLALYLILLPATSRWWIHLLIGISIGISGGHRFIALLLAVPYIVAIFWHLGDQSIWESYHKLRERAHNLLSFPTFTCGFFALIIVVLATPTLMTAPEGFFSLGDQRNFLPSVDVAIGKSVRLWNLYDFTTTPYLFYITDLFPAAIGTVAALAAAVGLIMLGYLPNRTLILMLAWSIPYFLVTGGLFTKPIRYTTPLLPMLCCSAAYGWMVVSDRLGKQVRTPMAVILGALILVSSAAHGIAVSRVYTQENIRFEAYRGIHESLPDTARIIAETGGFPTMWMTASFPNPKKDPGAIFMRTRDHVLPGNVVDMLSETVSEVDYWIIIAQNRAIPYTSAPDQFPLAAELYTRLQDGRIGYELVARYTRKASLLGFDFDRENTDPTIRAFDRPRVEVYRRTSDHDSLWAAWRDEVVADKRNPDRIILEGISAFRNGEYEASLEYFEQAARDFPEFKLVDLCRIEALYKISGADEAKKTFAETKLNPWDFAGLTLAGLPDRGAEYIRITKKLRQGTPENLYLKQVGAKAFIQLGYTAHKRGENDRAIEWYEKALELDQQYSQPFRALGILYLEKKQYEASRNAFIQALKMQSGMDDPLGQLKRHQDWIGLAIAESRIGNVVATYQAASSAIRLAPEESLYHLVLSDLETFLRSADHPGWADEIRSHLGGK